MREDPQPCEVPLVEQLRSVPISAHEWVPTERSFACTNIPYGSLCHRAANKIEALQRRLDNINASYGRALKILGQWPLYSEGKDKKDDAMVELHHSISINAMNCHDD